MVKACKICGKSFDPEQPPGDPSQEAGAFLARELWQDAGELCPVCLASRGTLGMMYCRELS
jgi:rubredoxin